MSWSESPPKHFSRRYYGKLWMVYDRWGKIYIPCYSKVCDFIWSYTMIETRKLCSIHLNLKHEIYDFSRDVEVIFHELIQWWFSIDVYLKIIHSTFDEDVNGMARIKCFYSIVSTNHYYQWLLFLHSPFSITSMIQYNLQRIKQAFNHILNFLRHNNIANNDYWHKF